LSVDCNYTIFLGFSKNFFSFSQTKEYQSFPPGSDISNDHNISKTNHDTKIISAKMQKLLFIFRKMVQYGNLIFHFPMCAPGKPDPHQFQCGSQWASVI